MPFEFIESAAVSRCAAARVCFCTCSGRWWNHPKVFAASSAELSALASFSNTRVATIGLREPFEDMSWRRSHGPLRRKATLGSHSPDDIEKYAFVVVLQIGQVVGKVCKVVADANLQVLADMTIDCCQRATAALT